MTWAANNAITLVPFGLGAGADADAVLPGELRRHMKELPIYIVEKFGKRINIDFNDLSKEETFWTVDCQLVRSAEQLVKEVKSNSNVSDLVKALGDPAQELPEGTILYNLDISRSLSDSVELEFEPYEIRASESLRRVDIKWSKRESHRWIKTQDLFSREENRRYLNDNRISSYLEQKYRRSDGRRASNSYFDPRQLWLANPTVDFQGIERYSGIISHHRTFLRGDIPITEFLRNLSLENEDKQNTISRLQIFSWIFLVASEAAQEQAFTFASTQLRNIAGDLGEEFTVGRDKFLDSLRLSALPIFDTSVWSNRNFDFN